MNTLSPPLKYALVILNTGLVVLVISYWLYHVHRPCEGGEYAFINPAIRCDPEYVVDKQPYNGLKRELLAYIDAQQVAGNVDEVGLYFRDLDNGPTLGLNEHADFVPASLLKLPVYITYLSAQFNYPGLMQDKLQISEIGSDFNQVYPSTAGLLANTSYSVSELLEAMIVHSDNDAVYRLQDYLMEIAPGRDLALETFIELGIVDPENIDQETLTVKTYASIFQRLYHSSYFDTREVSDQALAMLARTTFDQGLVAAVPEGTVVAHKFGERSDLPDDLKQLHDCGIIYYPDNAYLLCVMTRGKDFGELETVLQDISAKVYAEFDSRRLK